MGDSPYYTLDPKNTDPKRIAKEREKAQKLKKSQWWKNQIQNGICRYCQKKFKSSELTMDHVVPIARGGTSTPGNVVPSCRSCNQSKKLETPVEDLFRKLEEEKKQKESK